MDPRKVIQADSGIVHFPSPVDTPLDRWSLMITNGCGSWSSLPTHLTQRATSKGGFKPFLVFMSWGTTGVPPEDSSLIISPALPPGSVALTRLGFRFPVLRPHSNPKFMIPSPVTSGGHNHEAGTISHSENSHWKNPHWLGRYTVKVSLCLLSPLVLGSPVAWCKFKELNIGQTIPKLFCFVQFAQYTSHQESEGFISFLKAPVGNKGPQKIKMLKNLGLGKVMWYSDRRANVGELRIEPVDLQKFPR